MRFILLARHNHPGTEVVAADVNKVLKYMTDVQKGQIDPETQPFEGLDEHLHSKIPTAPNSVDFIYGGAPCQAFSGANHNPVGFALIIYVLHSNLLSL